MTLIISSLTVIVSFELLAAGEPVGKAATWAPAGPKGAAKGRAIGGQCLKTAALSKWLCGLMSCEATNGGRTSAPRIIPGGK